MSVSDSDSESPNHHGDCRRLDSAGRELVHNVATPLATLQLNLQVLSTYLPVLMSHCRNIPGVPLPIKPDHLAALSSLPEALDADIRKIRHAVKLFSTILVPVAAALPEVGDESMENNDSSLRILLVEDETIHQEITKKQCGSVYRLDIAANARDALALASKTPYDVVLLDLLLSGSDSRGLIGNLRAMGGCETRIIVVSNMPISPEEARRLEVDGVLGKPFKLSSLQVLLQHLRERKSEEV